MCNVTMFRKYGTYVYPFILTFNSCNIQKRSWADLVIQTETNDSSTGALALLCAVHY